MDDEREKQHQKEKSKAVSLNHKLKENEDILEESESNENVIDFEKNWIDFILRRRTDNGKNES